jgi:2-desacetyl-2-hydroxyethyl bacteriochlorophyllide A dehydrogenase
VIFKEANKVEIGSLTLPTPGPGDIVVRTLVSAISPGTERWILRGKHLGAKFPCVPGYHRIGVIEECGGEVSLFQKGDVVYGSGGRWEETIHSMWGAHVGWSVGDPAGYTFIASSMPDQAELETLAFTIVASVSNRGVNASGIRAGQKALIIGAGFVGVCAAQLFALRGAQAILLDKDAERIAFLRKRGYEVLSGDDASLAQRLTEIAPEGFDVLHDTVGHAATTDAMVQRLRNGGVLLLQAQYFDKAACAIDLDQIKVREITVKTTCGIRAEDWQQTMTNIRQRRLNIAPLITHRSGADRDSLLRGYALLSDGKPFNLGIVFHWNK